MENIKRKHQKISVIIPIYNGKNYIKKLLDSLLDLNYPKNDFEIIVVDNNSSDNTIELVKKYPVRLLEEKSIQSSYAARNKGIKHAKYDILAFIDADCIASKAWIKEGIEPIVNEEADLVGGQVEFYFSKEKTASELYDSITNMQVEDNIRERGVAKTANLFAKKNIFNKIGLFPEDVQSGGDVQWTAKATSKGFKLLYNSKAIVLHPARKFKEIIKKQYRVGKGMPLIWKNNKGMKNQKPFYINLIRLMVPHRLNALKNRLKNRGNKNMSKKIFQVWVVAYICKLSTLFGVLNYYIRRKK